MIEHLLAVGPDNGLGDLLVKALAVLGAAAVGAFGMGLATQVVARLIRAKPLPRPVLTTVRLMAAVVAGWLVALLLFHSGGSGWGWGSGTGGIGGAADEGKDKPNAGDKKGAFVDKEPEAADDALRVEVLVPNKDRSDRYYRVEEQARLLSLEEVGQRITERVRQSPPLRFLNIVIYKNSPDESKQQVRALEDLARDAGLEVHIFKPNKNAP
ncbi:MAG: hypothetical protein ACJ8FY_27940 [Gemmataceae bacterium]